MPERTQDHVRHIAGNVGTDPEQIDGPRGTFVSFRLATTLTYPDRNSGEDSGETRWYSVAVNRDDLQAFVLDNIHKGSRVVLEGFAHSKPRDDGGKWWNFAATRVGTVDWARRGYGSDNDSTSPRGRQHDDDGDDDW